MNGPAGVSSPSSRRRWRAATRPSSLALLVVMLCLATACLALGRWQWDRAQMRGDLRPTEVKSITDVWTPQTVLRGDPAQYPLRANGTYAAGDDIRITRRQVGGQPADYVLSRLLITHNGTTASLPVLRGVLAPGEPMPAAPTGPVTVTGRMQASEGPNTDGAQWTTISGADLIKRWGAPMYAGYLVVATSDPPTQLRPADPPGEAKNFALQNLSYALQWFVFAGFALFMWWRIVSNRSLDETTPTTPDPEAQEA